MTTQSRGIYYRNPFDRIMERVAETEAGCLVWQGTVNHGGYGQIYDWRVRRYRTTHRIAYEHVKGPVPEGLTIDHLCRVRACVNADHLEAVTIQENLARKPLVTHCKRGHEFTDANTYRYGGRRHCKTCQVARSKAYHMGRQVVSATAAAALER